MNTTGVEKFDLNWATVNGEILRIRPWQDNLVLVYLQETSSAPDAPLLTLALPNGQVNGQDISAMVGDQIRVTGWLQDWPYTESLAQFLSRSRRPNLHKELSLPDIHIQRALTCIVPEESARLEDDEDIPADAQTNFARVEGSIARTWEYGGHKYCRVIVFDRHTQLKDDGKRQPHYLSIQFTGGMVGGRPIQISSKAGTKNALCPGTRIRVSGRLIHRLYFENLRDYLNDAKRVDLLSNMPDADRVNADVRVRYVQVMLEARSLMQFA